ncbi:granzyme A-like [Erpetoichthys calabaricus]|nr:granzyme A-like [Erpetoichthys calabaricus]
MTASMLCALASLSFILICKGYCTEIVGGTPSIPHSRPFMVYLKSGCGGTLIKPNWVVTAAHCFTVNQEVLLGAHSIKDPEKEKQTFSVKKCVKYPLYKKGKYEHDIMLIQLHGNATLTSAVDILSLPETAKDVQPNTKCLVAGWGKTAYNGKVSDDLREVNVTITDWSVCKDSYAKVKKNVTKNMICAGDKNGNKDACKGDSGGPLICNKSYTGIVAFGEGCGATKYPGVYTHLTNEYLKWIKKVIQSY